MNATKYIVCHEDELRDAIAEYEKLADNFRAQSKHAKNLLKKIKNILKYNSIEHCAHNMAIFGSRRYSKYEDKSRNGALISCAEWKLIKEN
jgi:hypothetical protein